MSTDRDSPTSQISLSFSNNNERSPSQDWSSLLLLKFNNRNDQRKHKHSDNVAIERKNLVNISKLIIKELIEQSLRFGRTLDSDHLSLQHFFIIIEHVLRHEIRYRPKSLLGLKKDLWDILLQIEKYVPEAQNITDSVKDLPNIKTQAGRARAWLRIALMQKKLTEYLKVLLDHRDELLEGNYNPGALMLSDDAVVIIGLLIGLNTIDCNLCLKEDDLDSFQGVIDFSLYLKPTSQFLNDSEEQKDKITSILDQKNYIEELNEHLKATVANLQSRVNSLTNSNSSMKQEITITKNDLLSLQQENRHLRDVSIKENHTRQNIITKEDKTSENELKEDDVSDLKELKVKLHEEMNLKQEAAKELELQLCLKAEMEVAMKLLEKDIYEKQDTIVSLRKQLDDIKGINLEMYKKLQDSEASIEHKTELISKLEAKAESMQETIQTLESKYRESEMLRARMEQLNRELDIHTAQCVEQNNSVEGDLKVEREWRILLQATIERDREHVSKLNTELSHMKIIAEKYAVLQQEYYSLKEKCLEQEQTMEELGKQLSTSKLQISDLKEEVGKSKVDGTWADDNSVSHCKSCTKEFNLTRRRHHCRNCGGIFCHTCSDNSMSLPSSARPVRVCDDCSELLSLRNNVM
ncbi:hypothetical protein WA026_009059 [Henosepilachna vigintioctopunctata]|uniref:RUN and FYVE domain-containing protein 2 n=1 Tax=Henosepilachna vigintioctopunctata TaxID=420089 RepID=A0AAW1UUS7_9CUCU